MLEQAVTEPGHLEHQPERVAHGDLLHEVDVLVHQRGHLAEELAVLREQLRRGHHPAHLAEEGQRAVDEVTEVTDQLAPARVVQLLPVELAVLILRSDGEQIVPPNGRGDAGLLGIVAEDASATALRELQTTFILKIVTHADRVQEHEIILGRFWVGGSEERAGEDDSVERNVVLAHELYKSHVLGFVLPPLLPLRRVGGGDADVPDGRVEPDVEDFVLVALLRHRGTPLEVTRDAPRQQATLVDPRVRLAARVARPPTFLL
mmetsp:Transcript_7995/g.15636  ORF Transcript_7995/g.15636 Transcript_7995/m.15636 type:complete len:262 (+) Transcript_7995:968-1753(+)